MFFCLCIHPSIYLSLSPPLSSLSTRPCRLVVFYISSLSERLGGRRCTVPPIPLHVFVKTSFKKMCAYLSKLSHHFVLYKFIPTEMLIFCSIFYWGLYFLLIFFTFIEVEFRKTILFCHLSMSNLLIYLSTYFPAHRLTCLSTYLSTYIWLYMFFKLFIYLCTMYLSTYLPTYLPTSLPT